LTPVSGKRNFAADGSGQISVLRDHLKIDFDRVHPWRKGKRGTDLMGTPGLVFFKTIPAAALDELQYCEVSDKDETKIKNGEADHFIDVCKYRATSDPKWRGPHTPKNRNEAPPAKHRTPFTNL